MARITRMPSVIGAMLVVLTAAPSAARPRSAAASTEAAVTRLVDAVLDAERRFDPRALDALLAPGYVEVSPVGDVDTRAEVLGFYAPDKKSPAPALAVSERLVRAQGRKGAVMVARLTFSGPNPNAVPAF